MFTESCVGYTLIGCVCTQPNMLLRFYVHESLSTWLDRNVFDIYV